MTKIKICGIRSVPDALAAIEAGVDMLGFNFHPGSARYIDAKCCAAIAAELRREHPSVQLVGVFVNAPAQEILHTLRNCHLDLAQLSGDEPPEVCAALSGVAFKAFHGVPDADMARYARSTAPAFLLDGHVSGSYGGTGVTANWSAAGELSKHYPILLAGGLQAENVAQAMEMAQPWGVDVASGVESGPGIKDARRVKAFVEAVRSAGVKQS